MQSSSFAETGLRCHPDSNTEAETPAAAGPVPVSRNLHLHGFPVCKPASRENPVLAQPRTRTLSEDEVLLPLASWTPWHQPPPPPTATSLFQLSQSREQHLTASCQDIQDSVVLWQYEALSVGSPHPPAAVNVGRWKEDGLEKNFNQSSANYNSTRYRMFTPTKCHKITSKHTSSITTRATACVPRMQPTIVCILNTRCH